MEVKKTIHKGLWGLSIHANIKSDDYGIRLHEVYNDQGVSENIMNLPSFTGLKIVSDYTYISYVKIYGYIDHFYKCIVTEDTEENWFTDVELYADTWGCIGGQFNNIRPVRIFGSHQVISYAPLNLRNNGYFEGEWINLYGYVWDISNNPTKEMYTAKYPVFITSTSDNNNINTSFSNTEPYSRQYPANIFNSRKYDEAISFAEDVLPNVLNRLSSIATWYNACIQNFSFTINNVSYKNIKIYNNHCLFGERLFKYESPTICLQSVTSIPYLKFSELEDAKSEDKILHCRVQFTYKGFFADQNKVFKTLIVRLYKQIKNFIVNINDNSYPINSIDYYEQQVTVVTKDLRSNDIITITYDIDCTENDYVQFPLIKIPYYSNNGENVFSSEPLVGEHTEVGLTGYCRSLGKPIWLGSDGFVLSDGFLSKYKRKGPTDSRPTLTNKEEGFEYYDTTLKKKILWNGTSWVNIDGTTLE